MSDVAIRVESLGKQYRIGGKQEKYKTLRESLAGSFSGFTSLLQRNGSRKPGYEDIWALKDVSFEVKRGEVVGVIGRNGAGKSTLLKILSRITEPTTGTVDIYGRVGSLLEVGTGFHPELTGRENIYLNGAILGMKRAEIDRKFDEIVAFAEVEKFIDTPVKHYSSGMYLRLAFAVAAHLEPEILLVDEVLAVGDAAFQKKCLGKMGEVAEQGRTVLFVSHNMGAITQLCNKAIWFHSGNICAMGNVQNTIEKYLSIGLSDQAIMSTDNTALRSGNGEGRIISVKLSNVSGKPTSIFGIGEPFNIYLAAQLNTNIKSLIVGIEIKSQLGVELLNLRSDSQSLVFPIKANQVSFCIQIPGLPLYPGKYLIEPWIGQNKGKRIDHVHNAIFLQLESHGYFQSELMFQPGRGFIVMDCEWKILETQTPN